MPETLDKIERPTAAILGYGQSGAGKTSFIKTMTKVFKEERIYIMNFDPKHNLMPLILGGLRGIQFDQYGDMDYAKVLSRIVELKNLAKKPDFPYDMIVIENGAGFHKCVLSAITSAANRPENPQIQDWGMAAERTKQRFKEILELPCHKYFTFHEQLEKDEIQGKVIGRILVSGKFLPDEIPPLFNMFLHFVAEVKPGTTELPKRVVHCAPTLIYPGGDKTGALNFVEDPNFDNMWSKVNAKLLTIGGK